MHRPASSHPASTWETLCARGDRIRRYFRLFALLARDRRVSWNMRAACAGALAVLLGSLGIVPQLPPIFTHAEAIVLAGLLAYLAKLLVPPPIVEEHARRLDGIAGALPVQQLYGGEFIVATMLGGIIVVVVGAELVVRTFPQIATIASAARWPAIGLAVCAVLLEILLRFVGFARPKMSQLDPLLGWRQRPGVVADYVREGAGRISINAVGFRDVDHAREKPRNTFRIAVLGDSMTEAREVQFEETFWKRLESMLSGRADVGGKQVEVMNFAVNGYGTGQSYLALRECALGYHPDLVLLGFVTNTDIEENSSKLNSHRFRPYFTVANGRLNTSYSPGDDPAFLQRLYKESVRLNFLDRLRLYQLGREIKVAIRSQLRRSHRARRRPEATLGVSGGIYLPPERKEWQEAWAITEGLLLEMDRLCRDGSAAFVLAILPNPIQVTADLAARQRVCREFGVADLRYPDRRLEDFARVSAIRCISLVDLFAEYIRKHGDDVYIPNPGSPLFHFTPTGHELVARHIAEALPAQREGIAAPS